MTEIREMAENRREGGLIMNIISFATYDDNDNRTEYEYSINDLRKEYWSDSIDMNVPCNDEPIVDCELNGIPLYFENFLELVKVFGIERE